MRDMNATPSVCTGDGGGARRCGGCCSGLDAERPTEANDCVALPLIEVLAPFPLGDVVGDDRVDNGVVGTAKSGDSRCRLSSWGEWNCNDPREAAAVGVDSPRGGVDSDKAARDAGTLADEAGELVRASGTDDDDDASATADDGARVVTWKAPFDGRPSIATALD